MISAVAVLLLVITQTLAESSEDAYATSHVNFNEIFTNSLSLLTDDALTTVNKDDEFHLASMPTVDNVFHRPNLPNLSAKKLVVPPRLKSGVMTPEPRFITPSFMKIKTAPEIPDEVTMRNVDVKTTKKSTTKIYKRMTTKRLHVLPLKQEKGVLDILFPAARVKSFKYVFNSFKRVLSYTF